MKINEAIQPSNMRQRAILEESLVKEQVQGNIHETYMKIFDADRGVWEACSADDIFAELDLADQEDAANK
jgi:hypothetical protein